MYDVATTIQEGHIKVSNLHEIWLSESGNPQGKPVVSLHGGPGSASRDYHRQFFNPEKYRIIQIDQRGCGKSKPQGEIQDNTIQDLVQDIETVREQLSIEQWMVFGGSWGSTLGLVYAQNMPECVTELVIRGTWLNRATDAEWVYYHKDVGRIYPELLKHYEAYLDKYKVEKNWRSVVDHFYTIMTKGTKEEQAEAIVAFEPWDQNRMVLEQEFHYPKPTDLQEEDFASWRILFHYVKNDCFLKENQILDNASFLKDIPIYIVHGRYDMVCPVEQSWELKNALPHTELNIVTAGHKSSDQEIAKKIHEVTDRLAD